MRYSPPAASAASNYQTVTEAQHKNLQAAILARGADAVKAATKAGKRGSKAKKATPDFLAQYRALSGAEKTAFAAANSHRIFAAFSNAR